ncbi:MAG TPA: sodium ion-translocating decarboxylase subunit beta, partial [Fibrobacteria bacterium]|nr:sodium ion-translocating decarboxylase subunit beta [Fibrobacteria bacterium]
MNLGELFAAIPGMFQGVVTLFQGNPSVAIARVFLIFLGFLLVYLGRKGTLEPLLMIPMGLAMSTVNAGVMLLDPMTTSAVMDYANSPMIRQAHSAVAPMATTADSLRIQGTLHVAPLVQQSENLLYILQVDWLQPIYTFTFSNGLIACFVFMGIGCLLDVGYLIARPFQSMILALFAELGTVLVFPIGVAFGLNPGEAAAIAMVGGADGPMVLFTSLMLAKDIFVPICVVAYLYLGLTYGGYPYLVRFLIPKKLLAIPMAPNPKARKITSGQKLAFAVVASTVLSLLFPVAAPLILSLFLGVAIRESGLDAFRNVVENVFLYGSTLFLGLILGILCEANTILNPKVLLLLVLGILALLLSGIGG